MFLKIEVLKNLATITVNRTLAWVFSCKSATYIQNNFSYEQLWRAAYEFVLFS